LATPTPHARQSLHLSSPDPWRILIVDGDRIVSSTIATYLRGRGDEALEAASAPEALALLRSAEEQRAIDVVLCDAHTQGGPGAPGGLELVRRILAEHRGVAVIVTTAYGTVEAAVESLRLGACDYLVKPLVDAELSMSLERATRQRTLLRENQTLHRRLESHKTLETIVGTDPRMLRLYDLIESVAPGRTTVLMTGESGTGKSLIARAIHDRSTRKARPFVEISCGSIPETLLESELFGHVKGAFTGAHTDKPGRFIAASGGTLFLDEINSASPGMQLKLLRMLQERRFEPVGSDKTVEVDVRVILASNQPLEALVADGRFRQDLYYRINVVKIELPPLRDRRADVPLLAARFLERFASELGRQLIGFTPEAAEALRAYAYPGNVRELQNIIERASVLAKSPTIGLDDLPEHVVAASASKFVSKPAALANAPAILTIAEGTSAPWSGGTLEDALREPERRILLAALEANAWSRQKTSEQLGINRTTLYKKMKQYGLLGDERLAG
jgi:DNA-binding NtrC family response regulator